MLWCDTVKTWRDINCCMRWSCFPQLAKALWLSLYCIRCKRQIIALLYRYAIAIVARAIVGETTMWWHIVRDQGVMLVTMEIMTVLWRWRSKAQDDNGHIMSHIFIACDVYPLCILFCLEWRHHYKMIPSLNFKKKCSLRVCTIAKVRRAQTPRDDRVW